MRPKNLPPDANDTWGYDGERLVYLVRFNVSWPGPQTPCQRCGIIVSKDDNDQWEKHQITHRVWLYADTKEPYSNGLSHFRWCGCPKDGTLSMLRQIGIDVRKNVIWKVRPEFEPIPFLQFWNHYPPLYCYDCGGYIPLL